MSGVDRPAEFDFGILAGRYDQWYRTAEGRVYDRIEKRAVSRLLPPGGRLLDIGCGTGHWSAFFSGRGFDVTGVDIAPAMISIARRKRIPSATFLIADAHALPFGDAGFDVTVAITALEFVRDAEAVLDEMARCTRRPGGTIIVGALNALAPLNAERKASGRPPYTHARFFSPQEVERMLSTYGTPVVKVAAFVPRIGPVPALVRMTEFAGRIVRSKRGAFIAARVVLR